MNAEARKPTSDLDVKASVPALKPDVSNGGWSHFTAMVFTSSAP